MRQRGGQAPVAGLVRLMRPLGIAAPAVRTAVSRMVRQGWLAPVRIDGNPGYALTPRAARWLDEAAERIYRTIAPAWDGRWALLVLSRITDRSRRERVRAGLSFLGYAPLDDTCWLSPAGSPEVDALLAAEELRAERFTAEYDGDPRAVVARSWDLEGIGRAYTRWLVDAARLVDAAGPDPTDEAAFVARSRLVHEWRKFLFRDPGLPRALLPPGWPGEKAAEFFSAESTRLRAAADRFVDAQLGRPD